jgi:hypothetical protein
MKADPIDDAGGIIQLKNKLIDYQIFLQYPEILATRASREAIIHELGNRSLKNVDSRICGEQLRFLVAYWTEHQELLKQATGGVRGENWREGAISATANLLGQA